MRVEVLKRFAEWTRRIAAESDPTSVLRLGAEAVVDVTGATSAIATSPLAEACVAVGIAPPACSGDVTPPEGLTREVAPEQLGLGPGSPVPAAVAARIGDRGWLCAIGEDVASNEVDLVTALATQLEATVRAAHARSAEAKYRALVEQIPAVTYYRDLDSPMTPFFVSPQVFDLIGYTPDEVMADPDFMWRTVHPEDRERTFAESRALSAPERGPPLNAEFRVIGRDGGVVWIRNHAITVYEDGRPRFVLGVLFDVTRERMATRELENIFELSTDLICTFDSQGRFRTVNPAVLDVLGYTPDELRGRPALDLLHPDDVDVTISMGPHLRDDAPTAVFENRYRHKDGTFRWLSWSAKLGPDGIFYATARDVTESKNLEVQLRAVQRMEAVGRLAGGIAHDFNNLLTVIQGSAMLLQTELESEEMQRDVSAITEAADRAAHLTRQLLAFSRRQVQRLEAVDPDRLIEGLASMLDRMIGDDIHLSLRLAVGGAARILGDPAQLEQVLMNLAVNARDAMPEGGTLSIEAHRTVLEDSLGDRRGDVVPPGAYVRITVSDTGRGMDEVTLRHIFEPFFTTKGRTKGTGLGLATVYGVVRQHRGFVWVDSERHGGTTFELYLPEHHAQAAAEATSRQKHLEKGHGETILLVEDNRSVRRTTRRILTRYGYEVIEASNGREALAACDRAPHVELVLTDVVMPVMGGRELAERLSSIRPELRVLLMSGHTDDETVREAAEHQRIPFLQKPFDQEQLLGKVRAVLGHATQDERS